jgi:hypothetical protein
MTERLEKVLKTFFDPPSYVVMESFSSKILWTLNEEECLETEQILLQSLHEGSIESRVISDKIYKGDGASYYYIG